MGNSLIAMDQVHGDTVKIVDQHSHERIPGVDAVVSKLPGLFLTVRTADCVPILFADSFNKVIAVAHAGWRGSLMNISGKVIETMIEHGAQLKKITVSIGPAINACCYEIFGERKNQFESTFPGWDAIFELHDNKTALNLVKLNYLQLIKLGLSDNNIDYHSFCTSCDADRFYSYNRDKTAIKTMISFISLYGKQQ